MRPRRFILPQAGTGGYGIRPYIFCGGRSPLAEAVPRVELSPFVESEIRRGAFYMRPRRFALPQAGTGGYGIRPYVFLWRAESPSQRRCPAWSCFPSLKAKSVGAHSICARGSLPCRKRARADMESAPTFFVAGGAPPQRAAPRVEFSPFVESEIRRGAFYMRPRRFILPQAGTGGYGIRPYIFCGGRSPLAEAVPRVELSPFVESEIRRGAFYMRPRRFALPQAGTGGYGIRPYVFL